VKKNLEPSFILLGVSDQDEKFLTQSCVCVKQIIFI